MAGFDAGGVVEALDYAFDTCKKEHDGPCWRGPESGSRPAKCTVFVPGCHGVITEPNDKQIAAYLAGVQKLVRDFRGKLPDAMIAGSGDVGAMLTAVEALDPKVAVKFNEELAALAAALCSGEPTKDDILGLPPRVRGKFLAWLGGEVMNPEAASGGGSAQMRTLRSAAAG